MTHSDGEHPHDQSTPAAETLSPELALVDPQLAAAARERLPDPPDVLATRPRVFEQRPTVVVPPEPEPQLEPEQEPETGQEPEPTRELPATAARDDEREHAPEPSIPVRRWWLGRVRILVGATLLASMGFFVSGELGFRGTNDTVDAGGVIPTATAPQIPPGTTRPDETAATTTPTTSAEAPSGPVARRFAWVPDPGATAYHVEFFRGQTLIFEADVREPAVTVPRAWTHAARRRTLAAGTYRWYVWPVVNGSRATRAVVQARLVVPD